MYTERSAFQQIIMHANSIRSGKDFLLFTIVLCFLSVPCMYSQKAYTPVETDPLLEKWRWTHFNEIAGKGMTCMTEAGNGVFAFGIRKGLVMYDGFEWKEHNNTNGFVDDEVTKAGLLQSIKNCMPEPIKACMNELVANGREFSQLQAWMSRYR
jgi:hypothetical protein